MLGESALRMASGRYWNPSVLVDGNGLGNSLEEVDEVGMACVVGIGQDDFIPAVEQRTHGYQEGRGRARSDEHLVRVQVLYAVLLVVPRADGFPELFVVPRLWV